MKQERLEQLQKLLEGSPNDSFLLYAIAKEYEGLERTEEALQKFQELTELHPDYVGTYYHYAKLLEEQDDLEEALSVYEKGMLIAKKIGDQHALSELSNAKTNLELEL
ncbi:MAG: hypothetical protein KTR30_15055 [Saprospiraceae bacterium]|nr:hypothetical protein [Saprospiraceae bacterium]